MSLCCIKRFLSATCVCTLMLMQKLELVAIAYACTLLLLFLLHAHRKVTEKADNASTAVGSSIRARRARLGEAAGFANLDFSPGEEGPPGSPPMAPEHQKRYMDAWAKVLQKGWSPSGPKASR